MKRTLRNVIEEALDDGLNWGFYEPTATESSVMSGSISGKVFEFLRDSLSERSVGLLTVFASRRSLACWFLYCDDLQPLETNLGLSKWWIENKKNPIPRLWLESVEPKERGTKIVDCRFTDTMFASSAVCHAAKYAASRRPLDAIISIAHSHASFDTSPFGQIVEFEDWLVNVALPVAVEPRDMTYDELVKNASFAIPKLMELGLCCGPRNGDGSN
jgi:hypothetical protein